MGVGMVLRDEKGAVISAYSKTFFGRLDVLKAEAKAALTAIQVCKSLGFSKFHLEGDSQGLIAAINSREPDWSSMGVLVEDIKHELQSLQQWQLSFVRREGNQVAHTLANLATRSFMDNMWLNETPGCIAEIVQGEQVLPL
jgi:ribonuclease HI